MSDGSEFYRSQSSTGSADPAREHCPKNEVPIGRKTPPGNVYRFETNGPGWPVLIQPKQPKRAQVVIQVELIFFRLEFEGGCQKNLTPYVNYIGRYIEKT